MTALRRAGRILTEPRWPASLLIVVTVLLFAPYWARATMAGVVAVIVSVDLYAVSRAKGTER